MPYRDDYERDYNRNKVKKWREKNLEVRKAYEKYYNDNNKEKIQRRKEDYYQKNKDKIKNYAKLHNLKIQHIDCECGGKYTTSKKLPHEKTLRHQRYAKIAELKDLLSFDYFDKHISHLF